MFQLQANNGPTAGRRYDLTLPKYVLGRHPDCQIVVDVGAVSRQHCQITLEGNDFHLEDLKSRNGTTLNDQPVTAKRRLVHGDRIRVCETEFTFLTSDPAPAATLDSPSRPAVFGTVMFDDAGENAASSIMSRLDASSYRGGHWHTSPEVKLTAILDIMRFLGNSLTLDDVLSKILESLFKIFLQADRGFIVLEENGGDLIPRWTKARREDAADAIRISRTICRQVMLTKEAILSADAASDTRFEMSQSIADFRIRSMMCAPLLDLEGNPLGVLQIDTLDQRKRFQADDLGLFVSVATQAAVAIQNARLHEQSLKQRELDRDMQLARDVQRGFLPDRKPSLAGYEFFDYYQPADQVGGDYFDYVELPDGRCAVMVADVVGHGVAAALLMAKLSAEARYALYSETEPAQVMTRLNARLCALQLQRFVTMVMVVFDPKSGKAWVTSAGHMAPIVRRSADGSLFEPGEAESGLPLGIMEGVEYEQAEFKIELGDTLTLYTDGINECADLAGDFYTIDRMRNHARAKAQRPTSLGSTIIGDVRQFLGKALQNDDMCLVCFGRVPSPLDTHNS